MLYLKMILLSKIENTPFEYIYTYGKILRCDKRESNVSKFC